MKTEEMKLCSHSCFHQNFAAKVWVDKNWRNIFNRKCWKRIKIWFATLFAFFSENGNWKIMFSASWMHSIKDGGSVTWRQTKTCNNLLLFPQKMFRSGKINVFHLSRCLFFGHFAWQQSQGQSDRGQNGIHTQNA